MSDKTTLNPLVMALGAAFATSLAAGTAVAADNPFAQSELSSGYMVSQMPEGKCGEGKCGAAMTGDKSKSESKCGALMMDADGDGKVTKDEFMSSHEHMFKQLDTDGDGSLSREEVRGKATEGKCGGAKAMPEGKCGGAKPMPEGKCGTGK